MGLIKDVANRWRRRNSWVAGVANGSAVVARRQFERAGIGVAVGRRSYERMEGDRGGLVRFGRQTGGAGESGLDFLGQKRRLWICQQEINHSNKTFHLHFSFKHISSGLFHLQNFIAKFCKNSFAKFYYKTFSVDFVFFKKTTRPARLYVPFPLASSTLCA